MPLGAFDRKQRVRIWVSELPPRDAMRSDLWAAGMAASEVRLCAGLGAGLRMLLLLAAMVPFQCAFMQLRTVKLQDLQLSYQRSALCTPHLQRCAFGCFRRRPRQISARLDEPRQRADMPTDPGCL